MWQSLKQQVKPLVPDRVRSAYRALRHTQPEFEPARPIQPERSFLLPKYALGEVFPGIEAFDLRVFAAQISPADVQMLLPMTELCTLAAMCKYLKPRTIFEIGTYTGSATLTMAANTPDDTEIYTLDIDPDSRKTHQHGMGVGLPEFSVGRFFRESPYAGKVRQLLGNSTQFDFAPYAESIDLVVVDADHTYPFVKRDTKSAFAMLRPGGAILWDDYEWDPRFPECRGVTECVHEIARERDCFQIEGARFAVYLDR